jgi:hypothetical protein
MLRYSKHSGAFFSNLLSRYMGQLGLARRTKLQSLSEILAKEHDPANDNGVADRPVTVHTEERKG